MARLSRLLRSSEGGRITFWCPGCDSPHAINVSAGQWTYNDDAEAPTFTPSVLVTGGSDNGVCHSFVTDGRIQFLGDCTHALANQTVPLAEWPSADVFDDGEKEPDAPSPQRAPEGTG